jgi:hypothetical protein
MAFNKSPKVKSAREFAKKFSKQQVIILSIDRNHRIEYASYGESSYLCQTAKMVADIALDAIVNHFNK